MRSIKNCVLWTVEILLMLAVVAFMVSCELPPVHDASRSVAGQPMPTRNVDGSRSLLQDTSTEFAEVTLNPGEELWVIARDGDAHVRQVEQDDAPGCGALVIPPPDDDPKAGLVPVPLKHTDVRASVAGFISTVDVTQQFHNPFDSKIEAVYVFPLPQNAAVNGFVMTIGERRIRGVIRERKEAERIYKRARSQGHTASLMTQERPNIFTQKVANIEPGKQIDVNIRYFHTLAYDDGWYEFVFPMVVGPRYNPALSGDPVRSLPRGGAARLPRRSGGTNVEYLRPDERSGHDIALSVQVQAGVTIEQIRSVNHRTHVSRRDDYGFTATLSKGDRVPNKDFVLRYRVAGDRMKANVLAYRDGADNGYFSLLLYPPTELESLHRRPMEMVFVVDTSGSMNGKPLNQAKDAMRTALRSLQPSDTFQIIRFSKSASKLGDRPILATQENVRKGLRFVDLLSAGGGTEMMTGIRASLDAPTVDDDLDRQRIVTFMTDGYIGNELKVLNEIHKRLGHARIFSFGVGSSTNRYLLDRMAIVGRGAVSYISHKDDAGKIMDTFFNRIAHPTLTDVQINWQGMRVADQYPKRLPDMFVGRAALLVGRFKGDLPRSVTLSGRAGRDHLHVEIPVTPATGDQNNVPVKPVWARMKIKELAMQQSAAGDASRQREIQNVALEHRLVSAYTAFIAVDASRRTSGTHGTTVQTPVPVPEGVDYGTTVPEN